MTQANLAETPATSADPEKRTPISPDTDLSVHSLVLPGLAEQELLRLVMATEQPRWFWHTLGGLSNVGGAHSGATPRLLAPVCQKRIAFCRIVAQT